MDFCALSRHYITQYLGVPHVSVAASQVGRFRQPLKAQMIFFHWPFEPRLVHIAACKPRLLLRLLSLNKGGTKPLCEFSLEVFNCLLVSPVQHHTFLVMCLPLWPPPGKFWYLGQQTSSCPPGLHQPTSGPDSV